MTFRHVRWVLDNAPADLTPRERLTLIAVARWANAEDVSDPWRSQLATAVGTNEHEITLVLAKLRKRGLIVREGGGFRGRPVIWRCNFWESKPDDDLIAAGA